LGRQLVVCTGVEGIAVVGEGELGFVLGQDPEVGLDPEFLS